jgi:glutaryl-CoA dehydrogenase
MAAGDLIGCFGLTEPDAGSDPGSMASNAKKVEGGYKLNGSKTWITNAPVADVFIIWAKDEQGVLRGFIARKDFKGLETKVLQGKFALRASITGQIFMSDVFIPDDHVLPLAQSFRGPFSCLNMARYGIAWGAMGAAEFCWHAARQYTLDRTQFGTPLACKTVSSKKISRHANRNNVRFASSLAGWKINRR